jgi:hypothetical protein
MGERVSLIDHTTCDTLFYFAEEFERSGKGHVDLGDLGEMRSVSRHRACMRLARATTLAPASGSFDPLRVDTVAEPAIPRAT